MFYDLTSLWHPRYVRHQRVARWRPVPAPQGSTYWALAAGEIAFTIVTGPLWFRHFWQTGVSGRALRNDLSPRARLAGVLIGVAGVILMPISVMLTGGAMVAVFLISLLPVLPTEQYARAFVAFQIREARHYPDQADDGTEPGA